MKFEDREQIALLIKKKYQDKVKREVLEKNLEGLVDEWIEIHEYIDENGYSIKDLPTKDEMKWWFQDLPEADTVIYADGTSEPLFEIDVDKICTSDELAMHVFKSEYDWTWDPKVEVPKTIKMILKYNKVYLNTKNEISRRKLETRLINLFLVGIVRFNHIERKPYLPKSSINKGFKKFSAFLNLLEKLDNGTIKDLEIESFQLFDCI